MFGCGYEGGVTYVTILVRKVQGNNDSIWCPYCNQYYFIFGTGGWYSELFWKFYVNLTIMTGDFFGWELLWNAFISLIFHSMIVANHAFYTYCCHTPTSPLLRKEYWKPCHFSTIFKRIIQSYLTQPNQTWTVANYHDLTLTLNYLNRGLCPPGSPFSFLKPELFVYDTSNRFKMLEYQTCFSVLKNMCNRKKYKQICSV